MKVSPVTEVLLVVLAHRVQRDLRHRRMGSTAGAGGIGQGAVSIWKRIYIFFQVPEVKIDLDVQRRWILHGLVPQVPILTPAKRHELAAIWCPIRTGGSDGAGYKVGKSIMSRGLGLSAPYTTWAARCLLRHTHLSPQPLGCSWLRAPSAPRGTERQFKLRSSSTKAV